MYQNIAYDKKNNVIHVWDDELGHQKFTFQPYAYLPDDAGDYVSLDGTKLRLVSGNHRDNPKAYESDLNEEVRTLIDLYHESDAPSKGHRELFFDIEVERDENGYSTPEEARLRITSIAYYDKANKAMHVLLLDVNQQANATSFETPRYQVEIFETEAAMLTQFVNAFARIQPTIITGWNTDNFDIPYLVNRIKQVLGAQAVKKLSPAGITDWQKSKGRYKIYGVSSLDYLTLYKKFTYTELANYRLDTVAKTELGRGKVEYDGDLDQLFATDIKRFVEYNVTDVELVYELDEKLQLLALARTICHKGHVPYEDVYYASKYLDGAAIVDLKRNGKVAPNKAHRFVEEETEADALAGAYVMPPVPGLYKWIYDLDLTSLYPSIIMSLNISPETKIGVIEGWNEECMLSATPTIARINGQLIPDVRQWLTDNSYTIASNGAVYRTDIKGFLPTILEKWFDERVEFKDKRDEYEVGTEMYKFYDALQLTQKVLLNSFYGVLGLKTFRFHDLDNAGAITGTGQSVIKFSAKVINAHYAKEIGKDHFINATGMPAEFAFYTDTDSTFCSSLPLIQARFPDFDETDEQFMIEQTNAIASEVQRKVNAMYDIYAVKFHNTATHRWQIKQEYIAKSGLWIAKKRYAQWVIFKEGKPTDKLDIKGLDVVRSSFPEDFKKIMKETLWYILKEKDKTATSDMIHKFKSGLKNSEVLNVMKNSGVKEISKFIKGRKPFTGYQSGTPAHVKAAINFNDLLHMFGIKDITPIQNGEKVKWAYLSDNPYGFDTMALRGYQDPTQTVAFVTQYIDRNKIFEKELKNKLDDFYAAMNWGAFPENNSVAKFFSFGK